MPAVLLGLLASLVGLVVSVLLSLEHAALRAEATMAAGAAELLPPSGLLCRDGSGCVTVLTSKWAYLDAWTPGLSRLLPPELLDTPLAHVGVVFYATALAVWLLHLAMPLRLLPALALLLGGLAVAASSAFVAVQAVAIGAFCPLCLTSAAATVVLLLAAAWAWHGRLRPQPGRPRLAAAISAVGAVAAAVAFIASLHAGLLGAGDAPRRPERQLLASFDGLPITEADFRRDAPDDAFQLVLDAYLARADYVERKADGLALEREARRLGISRDALLQVWQAEADADAREQIDQTARQLAPDDPDRAARIAARMLQERRDAHITLKLESLRQQHTLSWHLRPPAGRPVQLDPDLLAEAHRETWQPDDPATATLPPLELVVFSDFQCPLCARLDRDLDALRSSWPGVATVYFVHFPLAGRELSEEAAVVAEAVRDRGGDFALFKRRLYESAARLDRDAIALAARQALGTAEADLPSLASDPVARQRVRRMAAHARTLRLSGTPALVANGRLIDGYLEPDALRDRLLRILNADTPPRAGDPPRR
ncbi:MAG: vitamin K epoxide reductase family protein [Tepidisphaerales bacterium]